MQTTDEDAVKTRGDEIAAWFKELDAALKREESYREKARKIIKIYEAEDCEPHQFNILYSNTETLAPALYNSTPRPVVQDRFKAGDALTAAVSKVGQRTLEFLMDTGDQSIPDFDDLMKQAVLEALLPNRGVTKFEYEASIEGEEVKSETICGKQISWDNFLHGYAKTWKQVPWVAYEHLMTKDELKENFPDKVDKIDMDGGDGLDEDKAKMTRETRGIKLAAVYEIWDKSTKRVRFVTRSLPDDYLKDVEDPLSLQGFYPSPQPLSFMSKVSTLIPTPLYSLYEAQASELNLITMRINRLVAAMKVRGLYDSTIEGLATVLEAGDNVLVPVENVAALIANNQNLEKAIWLVPIEKLISVVQQLYLQRQQVKTVIYEITGIADIMRGSSVASETLGAQKIKDQWGTLRLKRSQKNVMKYVRDSLRIMLEIAGQKFSKETFEQMTGLQYPTQEQKTQAQQVLQKAQMEAQQAQTMGQQAPPPSQQLSQIANVLKMPTWEEILKVLQSDIVRKYRIDIETNSTVDAEATEDKQNISELLNAMAQFLSGVAPLVETGSLPFEAAQAMLLSIVRRFRFGIDVEDAIKEMKPPQPPSDGKAEAEKVKQQGEQQKMQAELQMADKEHQLRLQELQAEMAFKQKEYEMKLQMMQADLQVKQQLAGIQAQAAITSAQIKAQSGEQQLQHKGRADMMALQHSAQAGEQKLQQQAAAAKAAPKKEK